MPGATERTLLFTDIEGSTQLVERLGDAAAAALWERHDRAARELRARHNGREIDRTDGFFLLFERALEAAAFAAAYHDAMVPLALQARVVLHSGPVTLRENDAADVAQGAKPIEVEGLAKPFAARLLALAAGGQTLISSSTRDALLEAAGVAPPLPIESHGHYRLKGVAEPAEVFELGRPGGPDFAPPPDTDKAYRVVRLERRRGGLWQPVREVPHTLPAERDAFIGRGSELHALAQRLEAGERLVSVLGPGGTGKTRFVRRYALAWLGDWPGGVYFCDLSEARSRDGVLGAVAVGIGVPLAQGDAVAQLGHAIAARGPCLVILDNLEQVLDHGAAVIGRWLDRAADASFLVTSRERLKIDGETVFPIEPLPVSGDAGDAIELFAARARAQRSDFAVDDDNRAAVAEVVRLLDGLPLAIELAAARARLLTPAQIVQRLRDRFALLAGARGTAARQATMRAAIDWSWDLLSTWERAALAQCSVFEGGFTLAAAESVLDLSAWSDAPPAMDAVQALLDKSLLRAWTNAGRERFELDEPHFGMYVSIHEYARERLRKAGAAAATEERHGHYFAGFGTPDALDALLRQRGVRRRQALALELDNQVAACRRAIERADAATAAATYGAVWAVLEWQGPIALGVSLGVQVLAISTGEPAIRMLACKTLGTAAYHCGDSERAAAWLDEALALARGLADPRSEGSILVRLGNLRFDQMRIDEARPLLEAALTVSCAADDRVSEGQALGRMAALEHHQGRWSEFESRCAAALALFREVGNRAPESQLLNLLAMRQHDQGHADKALALYGSAAEVARECGNRTQEATALGNIGAVFIDQGRLAEALSQLQAALAIHRGVGSRYNEGIVLGNIGSVHEQQGRSSEAGAHYETALAIAREVDNRRHELYLLGSLGALHAGQGRFDAAAACYRSALAMAQGAGYGVSAGRLLAGLAKLQWMQGKFNDAERSLHEGEALLRKAGNRIEMPRLLCTRARVELALGRREAAQAALAEAQADADALGVQPTAELRLEIDALRRALALVPVTGATERTLLFTDIEGSTQLVERLGDEPAAALWAEHDRRARALLAAHRGREIDRSDGFFLLFDEAIDAAEFALAYHAALAGLALKARVAIHVGPVRLRENSLADVSRGAKPIEVEGLAKPFAARLMALAQGGQVLLSATARAALDDRWAIEGHGHYRLKGLAEPAAVFELGAREGHAFTPPPDTAKAYRVVADGNLWRPLREVRHNLPPERDAFIGRGTELAALARQLDSGARLITLLGPGGTGKTRLVRRYGLAWLGDWPGGVYFCDLSESRSQEGVLSAVAVGLGVPLSKGDALTQLGHAIAGRGRCLVILDNAEQVLEHLPATLGRWLDRATEASFVVTSRERLRLDGEVVFPVEPLPLAGDHSDAIELFAARSRAQRQEFVVDAGNRAAVAEVVRLLDGLPLAIELAAARIRVLSPAQLVERLRDRFALLAGARGAAARQATLRAAIDWSWDLLTPWEQAALAQCAVFEGGFTLVAAEAVLDLSPWPDAPPVLDVVQALLDKSLLRASPHAARGRLDIDEPHFGMYVSIHEYARERLHGAGEAAAKRAHERHGRHFAKFGAAAEVAALSVHGGADKRKLLALELDNLVTACRRAIDRGDAIVAAGTYCAVWEVLALQGPFVLGCALGVQVLALQGLPPQWHMRSSATLGSAFRACGRLDEAQTRYREALVHAGAADDRRAAAYCHFSLGNAMLDQGRFAQAREHLHAALPACRQADDRSTEAAVIGTLALLDHIQGNMGEAVAGYQETLAIAREIGDCAREFSVLNNLAIRLHEDGRSDEALAHFRSALDLSRAAGHRANEAMSLGNIGGILSDRGDWTQAKEHLTAGLIIQREVGVRYGESTSLHNLGAVHEQLGQCDEARRCYEAALAIIAETGDRRVHAHLLSSLGDLHRGQRRFAEASECFQQGLIISRQMADKRNESRLLSGLARTHLDLGHTDTARTLLATAEALAREVGERMELCRMLCTRAWLEHREGRREVALATLAAAQAGAAALCAGPESELQRELRSLQEVLG